MARQATKAADNIWYKARLEAAEREIKFKSRESAAEVLGMSESAVADTELNTYKSMPPDKAMIMARCYQAPQLIPHYCMYECPVGSYIAVSDEVLNVDAAAVRLIRDLERVSKHKDDLIEIAYDGQVSPEEQKKLNVVVEALEVLTATISQVKTLQQRLAMRGTA